MEDWKKRIQESADEVEIPDSLKPEAVEKRLNTISANRQIPFYRKPVVQFGAAAAILLCIGVGTRAAGLWGTEKNATQAGETVEMAATKQEQDEMAAADQEQEGAAAADKGKDETGDISGYYYTGNYEEIKNIVKDTLEEYTMYDCGIAYEAADGAEAGIAREESSTGATSAGVVEDSEPEESASAGSDYSETNLQVEGVDEGDYVKTDGTYLYILNDQTVKIVHAADMELTATIEQKSGEDFGFREMYIDGDRLMLTGTVSKGDLVETEEDVYAVNHQRETVLQIYDLSDMNKIKKTKEIRQDGTYRTSRKIGNIVYLFSDYDCYLTDGDTEDGLLPRVNGSLIQEDAIYIPEEERGSRYLIMSAVDTEKSAKILDQKSILNSGNDFYITKNSVYVIQTDWDTSGIIHTVLVRFTLEEGEMKACAAASLRGELTDTFAVCESGGYLKVLLTDWSSDGFTDTVPNNRVYVLNEKMKIVGKISGIAPGETIYSARFIGDLGYFVTYRNTDPLFTVDFSDPENPEIIGELKVRGFSDYLHFYSDELLLGLGWETDPDSGNRIGLKLSMYDVSDPKNVKEKHKVIIKDMDDCPAMSDYKQILVNPENNLIGFAAEDYGDGFETPALRYLVFTYDEKEGFVKEMDYSHADKKVGYDIWRYYLRGLFIKDTFYVVEPGKVTAFDRKNDFKETGSLALS